MNKYTIKPSSGVNDLSFGMSLENIRERLGLPNDSRRRNEFSEHPYDFYEDDDLFVYYGFNGLVEAFEFGKEASLVLDNTNLFTLNHSDLVEYLQSKDSKLNTNIVDSTGKIDGLTSKKLGVGAWTPHAGENEPAESIIVFKKGYYDKK